MYVQQIDGIRYNHISVADLREMAKPTNIIQGSIK